MAMCGGFFLPALPSVSAAQSLGSKSSAEVRAPSDIAIERVFVNDGARISIGDAVIQFDTLELKRRLGGAKNKRALVLIETERVEDFSSPPRIPKNITTIDYEVVTEQAALQAQEAAEGGKAGYFKEQRDLLILQVAEGVARRNELDRVEAQYHKQLADHAHISESIRLRLVQAGIARFRNEMSLLKHDIEIKHLSRAIELSTIRSSVAGRIRMHVFETMFVSKDDLLFSIGA